MPLRLGIIGFGTIGAHLARSFAEDPTVQVVAIFTPSAERRAGVPPELRAAGVPELLAASPDLVVEAARPEAVEQWGAAILAQADLMPLSLTALADDDRREGLAAAARRAGRAVYIPHGGILGLDGIRAARRLLSEVTVTTSKPPRSLGRSDASRVALFEGTTREACRLFPRNVNIHAAVALAGIGFDRQRSVVVSDPSLSVNRQQVSVRGEGLSWELHVDALALGGVTGAFTPESAVMSVRRAAGGDAVRFV